jgi:hypothetical protein
MASTDNTFPSVGANVDRAGNTAWTSPENVVSDNGTDTTVAVPSDYLVTSGYGFAIPGTARILGVTVRVEASETGSGTSNYIPQLHSDTTPTLIGTAKSAVTVSGTTKVISTTGGTSDLWDATLTPAVVNAAGFGVSIWSTDTINTLAVDYVTIAIEWAEEAPWLTGQEGFLFRRNTTHRRLRVVTLDYQVEPPPAASADSRLNCTFRTVTLRSRRVRSVGWVGALAPAPAAEVPPVSAWLSSTVNRRRETARRLIVVEPLHWPYIAPEMAAILPAPKAIRLVSFVRKLQTLAAQVELPPPVAPPTAQGFPAWATEQFPPTSQDRQHRTALHVPVYPQAPAQADLPAVTTHRVRRRRSRQGLFLSGGGPIQAGTAAQSPYPSYERAIQLKRRSTRRKLQGAGAQPDFPATPAVPAQPESAWRAVLARRSAFDRRLQRVEHAPLYSQTPVAAQPLVAAEQIGFRYRRDIERRRLDAWFEVGIVDTAPAVEPPDSGGGPSGGDDEVPAGTFGDYSPENAEARLYPSRYEICDQSGFKVMAGTLVKQWDGARVIKRYRDERNEQDFVRARAERARNVAKSPEGEIEFLSGEVTQDDL